MEVRLVHAPAAAHRLGPLQEAPMNASHGITRSLSALVVAMTIAACSSDSPDRTDTLGGAAPGSVAASTPSGDDAENRVERALDADTALQGFGLDADDDDGRIVL